MKFQFDKDWYERMIKNEPDCDITAGVPTIDDVCLGCNGHGLVGGLTMEGYDSEPCPFCMGEDK
jgi:hypothetical protein